MTSLYDGEIRREVTEAYVRNATLEQTQAALADALLPTTYFNNPYTFCALEIDGRLILVDTGTGDLLAPSIDEGDRSMRAAGLERRDVDLLIITHRHPDHLGGLTDATGVPRFPNARVLFPEAEQQFIQNDAAVAGLPEMMRSFVAAARTKLAAYGDAVQLYADGAELAPGVTAHATPGHTPGHMAIVVESGAETLLLVGDAITYPALFVSNPGWHVIFDGDGPRAAQTRLDLLSRAASSGARVLGTHFPFPSIGRIALRGPAFAYVPERWSSLLAP